MFACLKELRNSAAAKLALLICVMGDEAAPCHPGVTEKITPKHGGKQFSEFEKFMIGVRDKDGDYLLVACTGKAAIQFKELLIAGRYVKVVGYKVNTHRKTQSTIRRRSVFLLTSIRPL